MSVNLLHSRRTNFHRCLWYAQDPMKDASELKKGGPKGVFYAKEETSHSQDNRNVGGVFMYESNAITISTTDFVDGIKPNDLVIFEDEEWMVANVQFAQTHKQSQYMARAGGKTYLRLRK